MTAFSTARTYRPRSGVLSGSLRHPDKRRERIEWAWRQYQEQMSRAEWLDDDAIPHLDVYTGTEIFAEAFGCKVQRPVDNMPFALPLVSKASEAADLGVPDLDAPCLRLLFEIADELRAQGATSMPFLRSLLLAPSRLPPECQAGQRSRQLTPRPDAGRIGREIAGEASAKGQGDAWEPR